MTIDDEESVQVNEKVESWLDGNETHQTSNPNQDIPNLANGIDKQHNPTSTTVPSKEVLVDNCSKLQTTKDSVQILADPKLSSTAKPSETFRHVKDSAEVSKSIVTYPEFELSHSLFAARQVIGKRLPEFNGDPLKWPAFISQYETSTSICQMTNAENFLRLNEALKGDAHKAVENLLYIPNNIPTIIEILQKVFGRPEFIINTILESIRSEPKPKYDVFEAGLSMGVL